MPNTLKLATVETLVLDEADEMLNMGFLEEYRIDYQTSSRKTAKPLFSATMPDDSKRIGVQFMKDPRTCSYQIK